ncbi:rod shape-determining protein [Streptomyces fractus]|uniref:rod shape-determining protein n=1 Tax=Streptomyces fractus TaxID=641806 RepID=UPI003CF9C270
MPSELTARGRNLAIDLGTSHTLVYAQGQGIILNETSVVVTDVRNGAVISYGDEAKKAIGRAPEHFQVIRPIRGGAIADFNAAEVLLTHLIRRATGRRRRRMDIVLCAPSAITSVERSALTTAAQAAGARQVTVVEGQMAAAIGAGLPVHEPTASMVVDIGGGTTDIAIVSIGGLAASYSLRTAGQTMDAAITTHMKERHGFQIGEQTAEATKLAIGTAGPVPGREPASPHPVRGRILETGIPGSIDVTEAEIRGALRGTVEEIVSAVRTALDTCPPELAGDIIDHGIVLAGGGALLPGLDRRIAAATRLPVFVPEDPTHCAAVGAGRCAENYKAIASAASQAA